MLEAFPKGFIPLYRLNQRELALSCHRLMESISSSETQELCCQLVLCGKLKRSRDRAGTLMVIETQTSSAKSQSRGQSQ